MSAKQELEGVLACSRRDNTCEQQRAADANNHRAKSQFLLTQLQVQDDIMRRCSV